MVGGYLLPKGSSITALTIMLHRDREIWGEDAEEFNPDHFRPETRPACRQCIQALRFRPAGLHRAAVRHAGGGAARHDLQRFELLDQQNYQLKIKSLTIKPDGLLIGLRLRPGRTTGATPRAAGTAPSVASTPEPAPRLSANVDGHNTPLMVLFGSNLGTAEGIASRIQDGSDRGYAVTLGALDDHTGELSHEGALVVVCASYNGKPPDNAERFCRWITDSATASDVGSGLATVFGCGNMDWASTYQAVPTLIDTQLEAHGARRVHARGEGDAALTSTVSSRSGIRACGRRSPRASDSLPSRPRRPPLSLDCASPWRTNRPPTPWSCPTGLIRPPWWSTASCSATVSPPLVTVSPPYRAGVAGRNGVPDR